jgi:cytochrome c oxidase subunit 2
VAVKIRGVPVVLFAAAAFAALPLASGSAQDEATSVREWTVVARRYEFTPSRIEVNRGDVVKITLKTEDIAHSFTIDEYRISKLIAPGRVVVVELCADRRGTFTYYCSLTAEEGCRNMRGTLSVR